MGWHPVTEAFRGPRLDVEDVVAAGQREADQGYEGEADERPGITAATAACRNGPSCRFLPRCNYAHRVPSYQQYWDCRDAAIARLRSSGVSFACGGTKYTDTTELWEATEELGLLEAAEASGTQVSLGEGEDTEDYVHVPHAALEALLASHRGAAAQPRAAPSEAEVNSRLQPFLRRALKELDFSRDYGEPMPAAARKRVSAARAALSSGAASTRAMPLADRAARMQTAYDELEAQSEQLRRAAANIRYDIGDRVQEDGSTELHLAAVQLHDGLHSLRGWVAELEGRALSPRAQLLELLRAAHEAGQDVLVYHEVS